MEATENGRIRCIRLMFWFLLFLGSGQAANSCNKGCGRSENGFLSYAPGSVYEYNYDSVMTVAVATTSAKENDDVGLKISGSAKIYVEGNCGYTLQLSEIKVKALKEGNIDKRILQTITKPVAFKLVDGYVEPEICVDSTDDIYSLNIKRAIISMFHASIEKEKNVEVDIFGKCPTHTTITKAGNVDIVTKSRNLNMCAYRQQIVSGIINGVFDENSSVKSSMLLQADYSKEVQIQNGIIQAVSLTEDYFLVGTPKSNSDVRGKVVTNMKLKNTSNAPAPAVGGNKAVNIIFQKPSPPIANNIASLKTALNEIVQENGDYVHKNSAKKIGELIRLMRNSDANTLLDLGSVPFPNKVLARKVYLDALFRTATAQSAKAIIKQFGKLNGVEIALSLLSLNLVEVVDKETIAQISTLFAPATPPEAFLAVGNLLAKYCEQQDCENDPEVQKLTQKFTDALRHCKANTKNDETRIVYALKGIKNAKGLSKSIVPSLLECASSGRALRLRVAALQAYSSAACEDDIRKKSIQLLKDTNEDSELRIEAYLAVIQCPNAELANEIADIVNNEKVYQVGGFIASHLRSIRDSTDIHRESLRHYLGNIRVTEKFPHDIRRFSFNNEVSYRLDAFGIGASADYKLIYSQKGFLPRSARLNITSELFGMNFNLMEANLRQENLESLLEHYFGPKGVINENFEKISQVNNDDDSRVRRSIVDDSLAYAKKYKTYGSKDRNDLDLDLSLKLFGSEMFFLSLGDNIPIKLDDIIQTLSTGFDKLKNDISNMQKEYMMHSLFIDTELIYPTSMGMPFEMSVQGISAIKIDFGIAIDIDALLAQNWQSTKYNLKVIPSVDANINLRLGFNAYVLSSGAELSIGMHSANGADISLAFGNENEFSMDVKLPREKVELIGVETVFEFYIAEQDKELKRILPKGMKKPITDNVDTCFDQLKCMGFTICFYLPQSEKSGYSLIHSQRAGIYINAERHYNIKGQHTTESSGVKQWRLEFSTPGSNENHDSSLTIQLGMDPRTFVRFSLKYPKNHLALEAGINNDRQEYVLYTQYEQNDHRSKSKIGFEKNGNEYRPVISLQDKNGQITNEIGGYHADGRVLLQQKDENSRRYNFENFQISNKRKNQRLVLNGWVDVGASDMTADMKMRSGEKAFIVTCHYQINNGLYEISTFVADEKDPQNIYGGSINLKLADGSIGMGVTGKGNYWVIATKSNVDYGSAENSDTLSSVKFDGDISVQHKGKNYASLLLNGFVSGKNTCEIMLKVTQGKNIGSISVKVKTNQNSQGEYLFEMNGKLNNNFIDIMSKCDLNGHQYKIDNVLTTSWGTEFTAKGQIGQRFSAQDILIDLHGKAQLSSKTKPGQWVLKVNGSPEKTLSEFKLDHDNQELIKYNCETLHPQDRNVNVKANLNIKNILNTKADYKVGKNGKGELNAHIDVLRPDAKHQIELSSKFHIQAPKYDIETSLIFDNDKKMYLKTENQLDKSKFSTKNEAEIAEKKISFDMNVQTKGSDWRTNGELSGNFICKLPTGQKIDGSIGRKITTHPKTGLTQGQMDVVVNEENNDKKRSLVYNGKLEKVNPRTKELSYDSKLTYTNEENKNININTIIKHIPMGNDKYKLDIKFKSDGNAISVKPIELNLLLSEYDRKHATVTLNGKYGTNNQLNVNGNYELSERNSPFVYNIQAVLQAPSTDFKSFELSSKGKYISAENKDGDRSYEMDVLFDEKLGNSQFLKVQTIYKIARQSGSYSLDMQTDQMATPFKMNTAYHRERDAIGQNDIKNLDFTGEINYNNKYLKTSGDVNYDGKETFTLHYIINSNLETVKSIDLTCSTKQIDGESQTLNVDLKLNDQTYALKSQFDYSTHKNGLRIDLVIPKNPKHIIIMATLEKLGERKGRFVGEISNLAGLDFASKFDVSLNDLDDFFVIGSWNSERLKLINYELEIRAKNKIININLKNNEGAILVGNVAYALKTDGSKSYLEGQGDVQYNGKSHNTNFKLVRQIYDFDIDKEFGFSYTFNGNFGPKNGVSTFKMTNNEFNVKLSICEEKKQCNNIQVQSLIASADGTNIIKPFESIQHSLLVHLDFRELGYPYEFALQSKTIRQGFNIQYSLDSNIISNANQKYQLIVNLIPTSSKIEIRLPTRDILFQTVSEYPKSGIFGTYKNSVEFYFDKTLKSNEVIKLESVLHITGIENAIASFNIKGDIKFEHPNQRPLSINGKVDLNSVEFLDAEFTFDILKSPEQQIIILSKIKNIQQGKGFNITTNQQIRSSALSLQYEFNGHGAYDMERHAISLAADVRTGPADDLNANFWFFAKPDHLNLNLNALSQPIMQLDGSFDRKNLDVKLNAMLDLFTQKPFEFVGEIQPSFARLEVKHRGLTNANVDLKFGKELTFHMDGAERPLLDGKIALDGAHFLETTYTSNDENIKRYSDILKSDVEEQSRKGYEQMKQRLQKLQELMMQQHDLLGKSLLDFSQIEKTYSTNYKEILNELQQDAALKEIVNAHREMFKKIAKLAENLSSTLLETFLHIRKAVSVLYGKLNILLDESLRPIWEHFVVLSSQIVGDIYGLTGKAAADIMRILLAITEKYGPVLRNYVKILSDALKPYNEGLEEIYKSLAKIVGEISSAIDNWISQLPTLDGIHSEIKKKIDTLQITEMILEFLNVLFEQMNLLPTNDETQTLIQRLHGYLEAKLKGQPVHDIEILNELLKLFSNALRSLLSSIPMSFPLVGYGSNELNRYFPVLWHPLDLISFWPGLVPIRFSLINLLLNEKWSALLTLDSLQSIVYFHDFSLRGDIADGHHLFTFDGQYYSFPGNCKLILAQDSVDNNFTIVIQQNNNGKLKSLILSDRDGNYLEINDGGSLKSNGNPVEYPLHENGGMHAWRKYYTVWLLSEYGVEVMCTTDLKVCHVKVNGFYTSKIRGLLGNGNAEPYDDFLKADGTIASDSASFGMSYSLGGKCGNPVKQVTNSETMARSEICNEIFSLESPLAFAFLLKNFRPYRESCHVAVAEANGKEQESAACNIALTYGSAIALEFEFSMLPARCLKCNGSPAQRDLYQEFTVKIPNNKADIVFVVDFDIQPIVMSNLVAPAITNIRDSLKARGFTDVQISVVAHNESQMYPALLTSDNGNLNYNGNLAAAKLKGPKTFCNGCLSQITTDKYFLEVYDILESLLRVVTPQSDELAFELALKYPFRAGAAKSIVDVRSRNRESTNMLKLVRAGVAEAVTELNGAVLHLLSPVNDLGLEGSTSEKLIGFNSRLVATLDGKDAKKRQKLSYDNNLGIDMTLNSGGWVFSTQNFEGLKPNEQKKALNQVTNSIADTLFKTEIVSDCRCLPVHGLHAQHYCITKSSNFSPNKKFKA